MNQSYLCMFRTEQEIEPIKFKRASFPKQVSEPGAAFVCIQPKTFWQVQFWEHILPNYMSQANLQTATSVGISANKAHDLKIKKIEAFLGQNVYITELVLTSASAILKETDKLLIFMKNYEQNGKSEVSNDLIDSGNSAEDGGGMFNVIVCIKIILILN